MKRKITYLSLVSCFLWGCVAEFEGDGNKDGLFLKLYGGAGEDTGSALLQLNDGYVIAGTTRSFGSGDADVFVVITDENGNAEVSKAIGGTGEQTGNGIAHFQDNLLVIGSIVGENGDQDIWLLEINEVGDSLRSWTFGSPETNDLGVDLQVMSNDNVVLTATRSVNGAATDTYLLKLDAGMNVIWENKNALNNLSDIFGKNIIEYSNDEVVYCGTSKRSSAGKTDMRLTSINAIGDLAWNVYFGESEDADEASAVIEHFGSFYVIGSTLSTGGSHSDIIIVRCSRAGLGAKVITLEYPGTSETGKQLVSLYDGNLLIIGERTQPGGNLRDVFIDKIDTEGNSLWDQPYVLSGTLDDFAADALETPEGDFVICGTASFSGNPMVFLLKMNKDGKLIR